MINFHRFFLNPFEDRNISFTEALDYGAAQLARMAANNPGGALTARINATTAALTGLEGGVSDDLTQAALQTGKVVAKDAFRGALAANIARIHGLVVGAFGPDAGETAACFPQGRAIFNTCKDEELNNHLQQLVNVITPKQAQVGAVAVTTATTLLANWTTLFDALSTAKGAKTQSADARDAARAVLRAALFANLLALAQMFPGDTDKCDLYCPQHLLRNNQSSGAPEEAELTAGAYDPATQHVTLAMHSAGATHFELARRVVGEAEFTVIAPNLAADTAGNATFEDTIAPGDYEYQAVPRKNGVAGDESEIVPVNAA